MARLPGHVAIIMDGNRRWARKNHLPPVMGHRRGVETFRTIMTAARELGIGTLSIYAFSSENWQRAKDEVEFLMKIFEEYCHSERDLLKTQKIHFQVLGEREGLSPRLQKVFEELSQYTREGSEMTLNACINYGSRSEILNAARQMARDAVSGRVNPENVSEEDFSRYLYTAGQPEPDLLIRTSGEMRISNFLLWQTAYSEIWFTSTCWPDFSKREFMEALIDYQQRDRRFGGNTAGGHKA
jgi:undecaprenyl diphosphate synthase